MGDEGALTVRSAERRRVPAAPCYGFAMLTMLVLLAQSGGIEHATESIAEHGIWGSVVVLLGAALVFLWFDAKRERRSLMAQLEQIQAARLADVATVQAKRVEDAQRLAAQQLDTTRECVSALTEATNGMEAQREALLTVNRTLERMQDRRSG